MNYLHLLIFYINVLGSVWERALPFEPHLRLEFTKPAPLRILGVDFKKDMWYVSVRS